MIVIQTFIPYQDFSRTAKCFDYKRLGKQRVEAMQILKVNAQGPEIAFNFEYKNSIKKKILLWHKPLNSGIGICKTSWYNHPAVKMWRGYEGVLEYYKNIMILEWRERGYNNTMKLTNNFKDNTNYPPWITDEFCVAHRSNLLRKNKEYYSKFNWNVADNLPYIWPV